jgi:hypothetical protein
MSAVFLSRERVAAQIGEHPLCQWCLQGGNVIPATEAVSHRGKLTNLCRSCEAEWNAADGWSDRPGLDGFPVDLRHPFMRRA